MFFSSTEYDSYDEVLGHSVEDSECGMSPGMGKNFFFMNLLSYHIALWESTWCTVAYVGENGDIEN